MPKISKAKIKPKPRPKRDQPLKEFGPVIIERENTSRLVMTHQELKEAEEKMAEEKMAEEKKANGWGPLKLAEPSDPWWILGQEKIPEQPPPYIRQGCLRWCLMGGGKEDLFDGWSYWLWNFLGNWSSRGGNEEVEKTLTPAQKQAILHRTDGYYRPGLDWESMKDLLPPDSRRNMLELLGSALLSKEIFEAIVRNPFYFLNVANDSTTGSLDGLPSPLDSLGTYLNQLWRAMVKVDRHDGHLWRKLTLKLLNGVTRNTTDWPAMGFYMMRLRKAALAKFADRFLEDPNSILHLFLRKLHDPDEIKNRREQFLDVLDIAGELSIGLGINDDHQFVPSTPFKLVETFKEENSLTKLHYLSTFAEPPLEKPGFTLPEPRNVVLMTRPPLVILLLNPQNKKYGEIHPCSPACVVIESRESAASKK